MCVYGIYILYIYMLYIHKIYICIYNIYIIYIRVFVCVCGVIENLIDKSK